MFWGSARRVAAYIVDVALLYAVLIGGVQRLTHDLFGVPDFARLSQSPLRLEGWVLLTVSLPTWLYFIAADVSGGATLGKRLFRLRARNLSGQKVGLGQAVGRTALKLLPWELTHFSILVPTPLWNPGAQPTISQTIGMVVANLSMLAYLVVLVVNRGRRSVHDLVARTEVTSVA